MMPLLREFREEGPDNQTGMMAPGMRRPGVPGVPGGPGAVPPGPGKSRAEEPRKTGEPKYPDLAKDLKSIQDSLAKLADVEPKRIPTQGGKFRAHENFNPFSSNVSALEGENLPNPATPVGKGKESDPTASGEVIPEHCLVRLVDIEDVKPGKSYRYRIKVRMANPNYNRDDVASAAYKTDKDLESNEWFDKLPTVHVPPETIYYAVDEKQVSKDERHPKGSLLDDMRKYEPTPRDRYVCFQLHRWLEETLIGGTKTPIGEWAIADRVFVARGEAVGRTVKVDLPVWKFTRDAYILPAEDQSRRDRRLGGRTGVNVNFGQENPENETLLLDFEGGRESIGPRITDSYATEVLMLSPDGKLLARNSATDAADKARKDHRKKALEHIQAVREGRSGGAGGVGGGGLDQPSKQ
jgi:hypothetical protein